MAILKFFHPTTMQFAEDLSADLITPEYTEAPYGSLDSQITLIVTESNRRFLESLTENSHYIKMSSKSSNLVGGVIEAAYIDKGYCHIDVIGFLEYLNKVPAIPTHKANSIGERTTVAKEDPSYTIIFNSDSTLGIFWEFFNMVGNTMRVTGNVPFFRMDSSIETLIENSPEQEWLKSFRVNALETPTCADIYDELTKDEESLPIKVSVDNSNTFTWILEAITGYDLIEINEAQDDVKEVEITRGDRKQRSMSLASGTDPKGNNLLSKISFNPNVAYSASFAESASKGSLDILRSNRAAIAGENLKVDQISFKTWQPTINIFDAIYIYGEKLSPILAVITEKSVTGQEVAYTGIIVTTVDEMIPGLKRPTSRQRRLLFDPAKLGNRRSRRNEFEKNNPTGFR